MASKKHHIPYVGSVYRPSKKQAICFGTYIIDGEEWTGNVAVRIDTRIMRKQGVFEAARSALEVRMPMKGDALVNLDEVTSVTDMPVRYWFTRRMRKEIRMRRKNWTNLDVDDKQLLAKGASMEATVSHYGIY